MTLLCLLCLSRPAAARSQSDPGTYRLRIANAHLGAVEASVDGGRRWWLLARVTRPATATAAGPAASPEAAGAPSARATVEASGALGLVIRTGAGRRMRLMPDTPAARKDRSGILVNVNARSDLFLRLLPPAGSPVWHWLSRQAVELGQGYVPQVDDVLIVGAVSQPARADEMPDLVHAAAQSYAMQALARLKARGQKPVAGWLTVTARTAAGDRPASVVFMVDGAPASFTNAAPYRARLDTRLYGNGEHLVEVRAHDAGGAVITQTRTLVFFDNAVLVEPPKDGPPVTPGPGGAR